MALALWIQVCPLQDRCLRILYRALMQDPCPGSSTRSMSLQDPSRSRDRSRSRSSRPLSTPTPCFRAAWLRLRWLYVDPCPKRSGSRAFPPPSPYVSPTAEPEPEVEPIYGEIKDETVIGQLQSTCARAMSVDLWV